MTPNGELRTLTARKYIIQTRYLMVKTTVHKRLKDQRNQQVST